MVCTPNIDVATGTTSVVAFPVAVFCCDAIPPPPFLLSSATAAEFCWSSCYCLFAVAFVVVVFPTVATCIFCCCDCRNCLLLLLLLLLMLIEFLSINF